MKGEIKIIAATIAFGMGINKRNVRFVFHDLISQSLDNYFQEIGRAGRDGKYANCTLFYHMEDAKELEGTIKSIERSQLEFALSKLTQEEVKYREQLIVKKINELRLVQKFAETPLCYRKHALQYLAEEFDYKECNAMCQNCKRRVKTDLKDMTFVARHIVKLIETLKMHNLINIDKITLTHVLGSGSYQPE